MRLNNFSEARNSVTLWNPATELNVLLKGIGDDGFLLVFVDWDRLRVDYSSQQSTLHVDSSVFPLIELIYNAVAKIMKLKVNACPLDLLFEKNESIKGLLAYAIWDLVSNNRTIYLSDEKIKNIFPENLIPVLFDLELVKVQEVPKSKELMTLKSLVELVTESSEKRSSSILEYLKATKDSPINGILKELLESEKELQENLTGLVKRLREN